jgi:ABC-type uncharacterized transport system ATPase subunit
VSEKMCRDILKLREYYGRKIEMRESVYKEEIQQLVSTFNKNYEHNLGILQAMIQEKFEYEEEIRELKESNQEFITKQSENFENLIAEMERHKQAVD